MVEKALHLQYIYSSAQKQGSSLTREIPAGTKGSGWELRHLAGSPGGGGGSGLCHTLVRVNTV